MNAPAAGSSDSPLVPRASRLTRLYILALSAVALLSLTGQLLVQQALHRQWNDSTVINLAGRQRMLSQKLTKSALIWQRATTAAERSQALSEVQATLELWKQTHRGLQHGDTELKLPGRVSRTVGQQLTDLQPTFENMVSAAQSLTQEPASAGSDANVARLLELEPRFLQAMDAVVFQLDAEARARVTTLRSIEWALFALTLLVLIVEGLFVFRPAVKRIREAAAELMRSREELRVAKEAAESASEQKTRFLATISHELRNPLHAILGNAELAARLAPNDEQRVLLDTITASGQSLRSLVEDLLDLACIQAGRLRVQEAPFDLRAMALQALAMLRPLAERGGLELRANLPTEPLIVHGDQLRVQQIVLNLLGNALKFTRIGSVTLSVSRVQATREVLIEVIDTGPGISAVQQAKIFEAFARGDHAFEREQAGVGLGLAICQGLVDLMRGRIELESQPGCGTRIAVQLPFARATEVSAAVPPTSASCRSHKSCRVLVAEDDPVNRKLLADFLRTLGQETILTQSGEEALARLNSERVDLALIDGNMPGMDGWEVARRIREWEREHNQPPRPLIAISAAGSIEPANADRNGCFNLTLIKPVSLEQLRNALDSVSVPGLGAQPCESTSAKRWSKSLARMQGKRELFAAVAQALIAALPEELETLRRLTAEGDFRQLARTAHLLKGQMAAFDEDSLVSTASSLESAAEARDSLRCEQLHREFAADAAEFANRLQRAIIGA